VSELTRRVLFALVGAPLTVALIFAGGWIFAATVLPSATIAIDTDSTTVVSNVAFTANTAFNDLDLEKAEVPAVLKEVKKTDTEKATATGKKDNGEKASGTMTVFNCTDNDAVVPAGTVFTNSGYSFTSNTEVMVPASDGFISGGCKKNKSASVAVTATSGGTTSNLGANREYTSNFSSTVTGLGSAMTGGTSSLVTVVSQSDIDGAVAKMKGRLDAEAKQDLLKNLKTDGLKALDETFTVSTPVASPTPALNTEASEVTVKAETTYTILGVKADYISQLIKKDVKAKIDETKQSILDDGLGDAPIRIANKKSPTELQMTVQSLVVAGPELDADAIKEEIKGKKRGDVEKIIGEKTGVRDVTITYKPFWVLSTPKSVKKITIVIEKPESPEKTESEPNNP